MSGTQDIVIAGGVEIMSAVPLGTNIVEGKFGTLELYLFLPHILFLRKFGKKLKNHYYLVLIKMEI